MRITRLKAKDFRGWADLDLRPVGHVVALGEPRAGRSDLVAALARVLDPRSTRQSPVVTDIHQRQVVSDPEIGASDEGDDSSDDEPSDLGRDLPDEVDTVEGNFTVEVVRAPFAEVEITLADLGSDLEQEALGALEPLTENFQVDDSGDASPDAALGLRLAYRVTYDSAADALQHLVYYPATSNPAAEQFARVPTAVRLLLPVIFLDASRPLQLRAEGLLRRLLNERDPGAVADALRLLEVQIVEAAGNLSATPVVSDLLDAVLSPAGPARRAGDRPLAARDCPGPGGAARSQQSRLDNDCDDRGCRGDDSGGINAGRDRHWRRLRRGAGQRIGGAPCCSHQESRVTGMAHDPQA